MTLYLVHVKTQNDGQYFDSGWVEMTHANCRKSHLQSMFTTMGISARFTVSVCHMEVSDGEIKREESRDGRQTDAAGAAAEGRA